MTMSNAVLSQSRRHENDLLLQAADWADFNGWSVVEVSGQFIVLTDGRVDVTIRAKHPTPGRTYEARVLQYVKRLHALPTTPRDNLPDYPERKVL